MTLVADIVTINARIDITAAEKRRQVYQLKCDTIVSWLVNGKPAPQPLPSPIGSTWTLNGVAFTLYAAQVGTGASGDPVLKVRLRALRGTTLIISPIDWVTIVNPPVLTTDGREQLIDVAKEVLTNLVASLEALA